MSTRRATVAFLVLACAAALACGGGDSTTPAGIVQLVSVTTNTLTIQCGRTNHLAAPDSIYLYAHLVNTSATSAAIDSIGSTGYISNASDQSVVGQNALNFTSVPYNPRPATLMARTGDLTLTVSVPLSSLCAASTPTLDYKDITASLRVTTSVGQYLSLPVTVHVNYVGGAFARQ